MRQKRSRLHCRRGRHHDSPNVVQLDLYSGIETSETAVVHEVRYVVCLKEALRDGQLDQRLWSVDGDHLSPNVRAQQSRVRGANEGTATTWRRLLLRKIRTFVIMA